MPEHLAAIEGITLSIESLDLADYILGAQVVVERKTVADLASSIIDRRLFYQVQRLGQWFERIIVLIEGTDLYARDRIHPNALRGALSYLVVLEGVSVLYSQGPEDTALLLAMMARHAQHGPAYEVSLHYKRRAASTSTQIRYVAEQLPGIGPQTARALLNTFGTLEALFRADRDALQQVPGVGPKRAEGIRNLVTTLYVVDEGSQDTVDA